MNISDGLRRLINRQDMVRSSPILNLPWPWDLQRGSCLSSTILADTRQKSHPEEKLPMHLWWIKHENYRWRILKNRFAYKLQDNKKVLFKGPESYPAEEPGINYAAPKAGIFLIVFLLCLILLSTRLLCLVFFFFPGVMSPSFAFPGKICSVLLRDSSFDEKAYGLAVPVGYVKQDFKATHFIVPDISCNGGLC